MSQKALIHAIALVLAVVAAVLMFPSPSIVLAVAVILLAFAGLTGLS